MKTERIPILVTVWALDVVAGEREDVESVQHKKHKSLKIDTPVHHDKGSA